MGSETVRGKIFEIDIICGSGWGGDTTGDLERMVSRVIWDKVQVRMGIVSGAVYEGLKGQYPWKVGSA
jgi:hypothetical protein